MVYCFWFMVLRFAVTDELQFAGLFSELRIKNYKQ